MSGVYQLNIIVIKVKQKINNSNVLRCTVKGSNFYYCILILQEKLTNIKKAHVTPNPF